VIGGPHHHDHHDAFHDSKNAFSPHCQPKDF
jgi:hypothetical protein